MAINIVEYDSNWERLAGAQFTMQHSFFNPHDFAITPNSYIFFQVWQTRQSYGNAVTRSPSTES